MRPEQKGYKYKRPVQLSRLERTFVVVLTTQAKTPPALYRLTGRSMDATPRKMQQAVGAIVSRINRKLRLLKKGGRFGAVDGKYTILKRNR